MKRIIITFLLPVLLFACTTVPDITFDPGLEKYTLSQWQGEGEVTSRLGRIKGYIGREDTWVWKGIPYARPPVGDLRWRAPVEPSPWKGVLDARRYGSHCPQYATFSKKKIIGKEDCLYLNIWRPQSLDKELPVFVWIHGGGNSTGSADFSNEYLGEFLAEKADAVFVSMNYRLGPFGWFTHPALRKNASPLDSSGNYGTLDIIQSLRWIHENIEAFGGDPDNVIIGGESAGGINILTLLLVPEAQGLFHKALIRSGGIILSSQEEGDFKGEKVLKTLLEKDRTSGSGMSMEETASYLRGKKPKEILRCYEPGYFGMIDFTQNYIDGAVIPESGQGAFWMGTYPNKVPIIIGSNKDEVKLFFSGDRKLRKNEELYYAVTGLGSSYWKVFGVDSIARVLSRFPEQPDIFVYRFDWGTEDEKGESILPGKNGYLFGACHGMEMPFFMGNLKRSLIFKLFLRTSKNEKGAFALEQILTEYQHNFFRTGDPNKGSYDLPVWNLWTNEKGAEKCLILNADYESPRVFMDSIELTEESVTKNLENSVPNDILQQALEYSSENGIKFISIE